jgi:hypothetical protein
MVFFASATAPGASPEFQAGWPQQVWVSGTMTSQPAVSSSFRAAKPMRGRIRSTRQVTNSPTRLFAKGSLRMSLLLIAHGAGDKLVLL